MNIEFKKDAVCFANGKQWFIWEEDKGTFICDKNTKIRSLSALVNDSDFQLNQPLIGDYLPKSELDTERKYNDAVEVFGLFGIPINEMEFKHLSRGNTFFVVDTDWEFIGTNEVESDLVRNITYNQLMAIGKLKRLMNEREDAENTIQQAVKSTINNELDKPVAISANKYEREISDRQGNSATVDVYDVLKAFEVTCPATQHAVKKLLCSGIRGHKDLSTDLIEAKESIVRAIELNEF